MSLRSTAARYFKPRTWEEAFALREKNPEARFLAGGTDLLPKMRASGCPPILLIDIKGIEPLREIREIDGGALWIGAAATVAEISSNPFVRQRYGALAECAVSLGSYPLRHRATIGGNICNASPCADTAAALLVLDAEIEARSQDAVRRISIHDFFLGPGRSALAEGELATAVVLPPGSAFASFVYGRLARRKAVDIASVAALVAEVDKGEPRQRISLLSVAPRPLRAVEAEAVLAREGYAGIFRAAERARACCSPIGDVRASAEYRREMVGVLVERALCALRDGRGRR